MGYEYNTFLPGLNQTVRVGEINGKLYRDLVKSLYNSEEEPFLVHLNTVVQHIVPGIQLEQLCIIDYLIILISARMICINPDLKLVTTCPETKKKFDTSIRLEDLVTTLQNTRFKGTVSYNSIKIDYSILKACDIIEILKSDINTRQFDLMVSSIDKIYQGEKAFDITGTFAEKTALVNSLPAPITTTLNKNLLDTYKELQKSELLSLNSPHKKGVVAARLTVTVDIKEIVYFLKLLFNDKLVSIYRLMFNLVSKSHFDPQFLDSITPAEQNLFWTFYLQQVQKETAEYDKGKISDQKMPPYEGTSTQTTPSEFS